MKKEKKCNKFQDDLIFSLSPHRTGARLPSVIVEMPIDLAHYLFFLRALSNQRKITFVQKFLITDFLRTQILSRAAASAPAIGQFRLDVLRVSTLHLCSMITRRVYQARRRQLRNYFHFFSSHFSH